MPTPLVKKEKKKKKDKKAKAALEGAGEPGDAVCMVNTVARTLRSACPSGARVAHVPPARLACGLPRGMDGVAFPSDNADDGGGGASLGNMDAPLAKVDHGEARASALCKVDLCRSTPRGWVLGRAELPRLLTDP